MNFIFLKASSGKFVSFELIEDSEQNQSNNEKASSSLKFKIKTSDNPVVLKYQEVASGRWIIQDAGAGYYFTASDDGSKLIYAVEEKVASHEFQYLKQSDDAKLALMIPDSNHYLSEGRDGYISWDSSTIGSSEIFELVKLPINSENHGHTHGCCGPSIPQETKEDLSHQDPYWNDDSHEGILNRAIALLAVLGPSRPDVEQFLDIWRNIPKSPKYDFMAGMVFQGLYDADYVEKYTDSWAPLVPPSYRTHFYNPKSRKNYLEKGWHPLVALIRRRLKVRASRPIPEHLLDHTTALTEGQRYFNLAVHYGRKIVKYGSQRTTSDLLAFGHNLGLCLHFLTDLTQPMYADNFTALDTWLNMRWSINFHGYFEGYVDEPTNDWDNSRAGKALAASSITIQDIDYWKNGKHTSIGVVFHLLATHSQKLLPTLGKAPLKDEIVQVYLKNTIQQAPNWVVRTLMALMHCSNQPIALADNRWYTITEITNKEFLFADLHDRAQLRCTDDRNVPEDNKLFCLIFNPDGSCSFVVKANPSLVWTNNIIGDQFYAIKGNPGGKNTSFKLLPGFSNNHWIYYDFFGDPNTLTIGSGNRDRMLLGEPPLHGLFGGAGGYDKTNQLFNFDAGRLMTEVEMQQVKTAQPTHRKYEWWGAPKATE